MAEESFKNSDEEGRYGDRYWNNVELVLIVDTEVDIESFYTDPVD